MKVLPLQVEISTINLSSDYVVVVNSKALFRRMLLCKHAEFEEYFNFKLSLYPTSI